MIDKYKLYYRLFIAAFWIMQCFGFVTEELLPPLASLRSAVYFICDAILLLVGVAAMRENRNTGDNRVAYCFIAIAVISSWLVNREGIATVVNGARGFFGLLFILPILRYLFENRQGGERFVRSFDRQLFVYLWLQAICITIQFVKYGAGDAVGGTMGYGASGTVSTCICFVSYYLMTKRWNENLSYGRNIGRNWVLIFLLYPVFLNETKISFIFLFCYFLLLLKLNKQSIKHLIIAIPLMIVVLIGLGGVYLDVTDQEAADLTSSEFYDNYLFGGDDLERMVEVALLVQDGTIEIDESDMWSVDIPRFTKLLELPTTLKPTKGGMTLGAGLGQFKGGTTMEASKFARDNHWMLLGSRPWSFYVIIQLGLVGLVWFFVAIARIINYKSKTYSYAKNIKLFLTVIILLSLFYNDSLIFFQYCTILFYIVTFSSIKPNTGEDVDAAAQPFML